MDVFDENWVRGDEKSSVVAPERLVGIDVARGLAIIGMIGVHILDPGPVPGMPWVPENWHEIFSGRSRVLFALVAGISLALMSGRTKPFDSIALLQVRMKIVVRALLIFAIGSALMALHTTVGVILEYYGVLFILVLPFLRWRSRDLFMLAGGLAVVLPPLYLVLNNMAQRGELGRPTTITRLIVTGQYPALLFIIYIIVGLGVGRLALTSRSVQRRLLGIGTIVAVIGFVGARVVKHLLIEKVPESGEIPGLFDMGRMAILGQRSGNWFEIIGPTGVALTIVGASLLAVPKLRTLLYPISSSGSMALTVYVLHTVSMVWIHPTIDSQHQIFLWTLFVTFLATILWASMIGKGPVETMLTQLAIRTVPSRIDSKEVIGCLTKR